MNARRKVATILAGATLAVTSFGGFQAASASGGAAEGANPNLLTNGALMPTTQGWAKVGTGTFASGHFLGATLTNTKATLDESSVVGYQCLSLPSALTYTLEGSLKVAPDQGRSGEAYVIASYYEKPGCVAPNVDSHESQRFAETDGWVDLTMLLSRSNSHKAKSMGIVLVVDKNSTNRFMFKDKTFGAQFKNFSLRANTGGGGVTCVAFAGSCGEDEEPGGQVACTDEDCAADDGTGTPPPASDEPIPADAGDDPTPIDTPAVPGDAPAPAPDTADDEPAGDNGDAPSGGESHDIPGEAPGQESPTSDGDQADHDAPTSGGGAPNQPTGSGAPSEPSGSGAPAKPAKPTLQPQGPGPINAVTPTPGAPATGGDNPNDPADGLSGGPGESDQAAGFDGDGDDSEPASALPLMLAGSLGATGLGLILAFAFRRRSHR